MRRGGFRAAAGRLNLTQSAVSARVAALERLLGVILFDRARRGARLTAEGRAFMEEAERLIALRDRIAASLSPGGGFAGVMRIGVAETIVHTWLPGMLTRLSDRLPAMRLELSVDTSPSLAAKLTDGEVDVAVMMRDLVPAAAARAALYACPLGWFAAADAGPWAAPLDLAALARLPIVTFARGTLPYVDLARRLRRAAPAPPLLHACASLSTTLHLTAAGFGVGLLPEPMAARDLAAGRLRRVPTAEDATLPDLTFDFAHMPDQSAPLMAEILDAAQAAVAALDRSE